MNAVRESVYARNARALREMHAKAVRTGRKVGGYTAEECDEAATRYEKIAAGELPPFTRRARS